MKWDQILLRAMKKKGINYGEFTRLTGKSYGYWYNQIHLEKVKGPPTLESARVVAKVLDIDVNMFVNVVFRDRLLRHLQKEKLLKNPPTREIRSFVRAFREWAPEKGHPLRF